MKIIPEEQINKVLDFPSLINALELAFKEDCEVPTRHHHDYKPGEDQATATLLLMPAWQGREYYGLKIINVTPDNASRNLPSIQGIYLLFDTLTGTPLLQMDAKMLTNWRTAAASALASRFLSRLDSQTLLMVGTGSLAPYLIRAHANVRPIKKVLVWGRNLYKAEELIQKLQLRQCQLEVANKLEEAVRQADIISMATMSSSPLLKGEWLNPGQHVDLVGSYKPDMREADDLTIQRSSIFVDIRSTAPKESGDLFIPLQNGILQHKDILADLFELCRAEHSGRSSEKEITLFKSVGHALEDLAAAQLVYQKI